MVNKKDNTSKFKRNDKVYILDRYIARPKFSLTVQVPTGKLLIIKRVCEPGEFNEDWIYCCERIGFGNGYLLPIEPEHLYNYTKIGELLYG